MKNLGFSELQEISQYLELIDFELIKRGAYTAAEMNSQLADLGDFTAPPRVRRAVR
jgi:hypothetical protein